MRCQPLRGYRIRPSEFLAHITALRNRGKLSAGAYEILRRQPGADVRV